MEKVFFGKVISENPLKVFVEQKFILSEKQLITAEYLTDYKINCKLRKKPNGNWEEYEAQILNHLKTDDKVILIPTDNENQYLIIDRVV